MRRSRRHHHASRRGFRVRFGAALIATIASIVLLAGGLLPAGADETAPVEQASTASVPEETPPPPPEETPPPPPVEETPPPAKETSSVDETTTTSSTAPSQPQLTATAFSALDVGTLATGDESDSRATLNSGNINSCSSG